MGQPGIAPTCLQSGNPSRHSSRIEDRGTRTAYDEDGTAGFWSLTVGPNWVADLVREAVALTSILEIDRDDVDYGGSTGVTRTQGTSRRRDQPIAAARVLGLILGDYERRCTVEVAWRLGGAEAVSGLIVLAAQSLFIPVRA